MKIAVCSSYVPFVQGGARNIVEWLEPALMEAGHQVERIYLPHVDTPELLFQQMAAYRWVDLAGSADRIICFRPPAHFIPHPNKILWFIHHIRSFYDLWDSPYRGCPDDLRHRGIRDALRNADTQALRESRRIYTNSHVVSDRLQRYNRTESEVLYPPLHRPERFQNHGFNDEIVCICRIEHHKRQHLLVDALKYTTTPVRLRLCGTSSGTAYPDELRATVISEGLQDRVVFDQRWISEEEKVALLSTCLAAAYLPVDEDSYGYPSIEASHAAKPVLTSSDAGGVLELVRDGYNGLVAEPEPREVANAMDRLFLDRAATQAMGRNAEARLKELDITWAHVVERLLS